MPIKKLIDNLPWIAPTAALVFAASGYFDRSNEQQALPAAAPVGAVSQPVAQPQFEVTRSTPELDMLPTAEIAAPSPAPQTVEIAPEPTPAPAAPQPRAPQVATPAITDPGAFFAAAQANLVQQNSCVDDLRRLASNARVYFPSGGLAGADPGLVQARLIGTIAQECPGVVIQVEGHSDPSGDPRVNLRLSQQRADAVVARLQASGIDTSKFVAVGMGDRQPSNVRGPEPAHFYDRRVEFSIVLREDQRTASLQTGTDAQLASGGGGLAPCVAELERLTRQTKVYYTPGSVTIAPNDVNAALSLAERAAACPQARLRVIGQHSDEIGSGENAKTGRLRAVVMMSTLVGAGIQPDKIILAAPSWSVNLPGQQGIANSRIDFDVIVDEG